MPEIDETTKNTLDVLVYVQQLVNDVDRLYRKEDNGTEENVICDE